jgi:hypothetical protein
MILNSVVREEMVQSILANDIFGALCIDYMDMMSDGEVVSLYTGE